MPKPVTYATDEAASDEENEQGPSRADKKRSRRVQEDELARLARDLVAQNERRLEQLALPDSVLDAVLDARRIASAPARNRQLRMVRAALREGDWATIRVRLAALVAHGSLGSPDAAVGAEAAHWVTRLLGEGSAALDSLLSAYPNADRTRIRQLVRNVERSSAERRRKAEQKLLETVNDLLRAQARSGGSRTSRS
jgi:ribosome-associated protein